MKLHLPKQLFTALLTAITLAAAPAAWGVADPNDLNVSRLGHLYAGDFAFSFTIGEDDLSSSDTSDVLGLYWGEFSTGDLYSNGFVLNYNNDGTITLTVGDGSMSGVDDTQDVARITDNTSFTPNAAAARKKAFTVELESGATYILKNTGADQNQTVSLLKDGQIIESVSYNGNMNGNTQTLKSLGNKEYDVTSVSLWKGTGENNGLTTQSDGKYTNIFGTPASLESANLVFTAEASVSKTVTLDGTNLSVAGISVYGNYTFEASADTTLTTTNGATIASGATLTLSGSGNITLSGPVNIAGELTLASSNQFSNLGDTTVKNGGVLNLTAFNTDKTFFKTVNDQASLTTEAGGYVKMKLQGGDKQDDHELKLDSDVTTLAKNVWFVDEYVAVHGDSKNRTLTIAENTYFRASAGLQLWSDACIEVDGGHLIADSGITLGHYSLNGDHWGKLKMTSGSITTGTISFNQQANNAITITGGELTFTAAQAFATATDKTVAVSIGGEGESTVTLKTAGTAWTLDGSVLTTAPTIGNVTIDAENAHGITLKNVNLTGAITNNSSLTIGAATVAVDSTVSIGGSGITALTGTITNNGSLTLNGTLDVQDVSTMAARPESAVTYAGGQVEGNGFRSQEYILIQGGSITYDEGFELLVAGSAVTPTVQSSSELSAAVRDGSFHVFTGAETIASTAATSYYVAEGGTLTFSDALTGARTMDITGTGTVAITIGDTSGHGNTLTASNFNGVVQISKDAAGRGNVNLTNDNYRLGASASFKLVSGNHWSQDGNTITRDIELAGADAEAFTFEHAGTLELSGKVTGSYLTAGIEYNKPNVSNNLTLSGKGSSIGAVTMKGGTLTVNAGMTFGTLSAKAVSLGNGTALNVGSGNVEGLLTLGTNASLTVSNGTLNLLGGVSSAADSADSTALPSITGNVGIASTLQVDGYLTMDGSVTLSGDLATNYTSYKNATETYVLYALNKETGSYEYVETASGNGFLKVNGASYWLTQGENGGITLNGITEGQTTVRHGEADYTLYRDNGDEGEGTSGHYYFLVSENTGTVYYVTAGSVDVDSAVQGKATGYVLNTADPDNEAIMNIKDGKVNTSLISYTSGKINLKAGAVLNVDAETNNMTVGGLLSGIVTGEGRVKLTDTQTLTDGTTTTFGGILEIAGNGTDKAVQLNVGTGPSQSVNLSSISNIVLNNGAQLYLHADPKLDQDFKKISVETGKGFLYLRDSDGAPLYVGEMAVASSSNLTIWSNWFDSAVTVDALTGSGTFQVESSDDSAQNASVTVNSLVGFTGDINIIQDTARNLKVELSTGTVENGKSVSISSITVNDTNTNGQTDFDMNVQADTSVGTLSVNGNGSNAFNIAKDCTLQILNTAAGSSGTITLSGSGIYDLNSNTNLAVDTTADNTSWTGTVKFTGGNTNTNIAKIGNVNSVVELKGANGYVHNATLTTDLKLTNLTADSVTGDNHITNANLALQLDNGSSTSAHSSTFAGKISGTGSMAYVWNQGSGKDANIYIESTTSDWDGWFITSDSAKKTVNVTFKSGGQVFDEAGNGGVIDWHETSQTNVIIDSTAKESKKTEFYGAISNVDGLSVKTDAEFKKEVDVNSVTVTSGKTASFGSQLDASTVNLGTATLTGKDSGKVTMSNVQMSSTGIASAATDGTKGSISNADVQIAQLAQDASFTIQDMMLTNTTITAATETRVNLSNVSGNATLATGKFHMQGQLPVALVNAGGSAVKFSSSALSGLTLNTADSSASLVVDLGDLSCLTPMGPGKYDLTITLSGFIMEDYNGLATKAGLVFAADSWLGSLLNQAQNANVQMTIAQAESGAAAAAEGGSASGVSYSTGNVGTIITITGLNVPEPTTSTLSLLALAALAARRRRK